MTKSIREFIASKLRRSESSALLQISDGADHGDLGAHQGTLSSTTGRLAFFEHGFCTEDGRAVRYGDIERVAREDPSRLAITLREGATIVLSTSEAGGEVVHATLRWIGNALLRRRLAD